jgi:hypothetical protein
MINNKNKTDGYVLSVDPASNLCGVSLWRDGVYIAGSVFASESRTDPYSKRLQDICRQLGAFLSEHVGSETIRTVVAEGVRSRLVQIALGAILTDAHISAHLSPKGSFIESMQWKRWAKQRGATGPTNDIKGVKALTEAGWPMTKFPVTSDDVADSILIYLTWKDRQ